MEIIEFLKFHLLTFFGTANPKDSLRVLEEIGKNLKSVVV